MAEKQISVDQLVKELEVEYVVKADPQKMVQGGYVGDLLSNVMARASEGDVWITIQGHQNVAAVALLTNIAAVIVAENFEIEEETKQRAQEKEINLLTSSLSAYELAGKLYQLEVCS